MIKFFVGLLVGVVLSVVFFALPLVKVEVLCDCAEVVCDCPSEKISIYEWLFGEKPHETLENLGQ